MKPSVLVSLSTHGCIGGWRIPPVVVSFSDDQPLNLGKGRKQGMLKEQEFRRDRLIGKIYKE